MLGTQRMGRGHTRRREKDCEIRGNHLAEIQREEVLQDGRKGGEEAAGGYDEPRWQSER